MSIYLGDTPICGGIEGNQLNNPFSLLDYKFSEYEITNASWLRSNGQYNSGTTYADVYNLLLQIYNGTVTKAGVSVKLSIETYADTDFVLNTSDITFRLPTKVALASGKAVAGNGLSLGLTAGSNINGSLAKAGANDNVSIWSNIYGSDVGSTPVNPVISSSKSLGVTTDPTKSGIETSANGLYLYFYVGAVIQDASVIAAASVLTDVANLKAHYIVETYVNGTSWYRIYSDGWCEQGGILSGGNWAERTINFLKEYIDTNYIVTRCYTGVTSNQGLTAAEGGLSSKNKASCTLYTQWNSNVMWQACGYIR